MDRCGCYQAWFAERPRRDVCFVWVCGVGKRSFPAAWAKILNDHQTALSRTTISLHSIQLQCLYYYFFILIVEIGFWLAPGCCNSSLPPTQCCLLQCYLVEGVAMQLYDTSERAASVPNLLKTHLLNTQIWVKVEHLPTLSSPNVSHNCMPASLKFVCISPPPFLRGTVFPSSKQQTSLDFPFCPNFYQDSSLLPLRAWPAFDLWLLSLHGFFSSRISCVTEATLCPWAFSKLSQSHRWFFFPGGGCYIFYPQHSQPPGNFPQDSWKLR